MSMEHRCRRCGEVKPEEEVVTNFMTYNKPRVRFRSCRKCRRELQRLNYEKRRNKRHAEIL